MQSEIHAPQISIAFPSHSHSWYRYYNCIVSYNIACYSYSYCQIMSHLISGFKWQASWRVALQFRELVGAAQAGPLGPSGKEGVPWCPISVPAQVQQSLVTQNAALHACSESWLRAMQLLQIALKHQHRLSCTSFGSVLKLRAVKACHQSRIIKVTFTTAYCHVHVRPKRRGYGSVYCSAYLCIIQCYLYIMYHYLV